MRLAKKAYNNAPPLLRNVVTLEDIYAEACLKWAAVQRKNAFDAKRGSMEALLTTAITNHLRNYMEGVTFANRRPLVTEVTHPDGSRQNIFDNMPGGIDQSVYFDAERRVGRALAIASQDMLRFLMNLAAGEVTEYVCTTPGISERTRKNIEYEETRRIRERLRSEAGVLRRSTGVTCDDLKVLLRL